MNDRLVVWLKWLLIHDIDLGGSLLHASSCRHAQHTGIILCVHPANESRRYIVTPSLIGWVHTQNDPWACIYPQGNIIHTKNETEKNSFPETGCQGPGMSDKWLYGVLNAIYHGRSVSLSGQEITAVINGPWEMLATGTQLTNAADLLGLYLLTLTEIRARISNYCKISNISHQT